MGETPNLQGRCSPWSLAAQGPISAWLVLVFVMWAPAPGGGGELEPAAPTAGTTEQLSTAAWHPCPALPSPAPTPAAPWSPGPQLCSAVLPQSPSPWRLGRHHSTRAPPAKAGASPSPSQVGVWTPSHLHSCSMGVSWEGRRCLACTHTHVQTQAHMYAHTHACAHVQTQAHMHKHMHVQKVHTCTHICRHKCAHTCACTYVETQLHMCSTSARMGRHMQPQAHMGTHVDTSSHMGRHKRTRACSSPPPPQSLGPHGVSEPQPMLSAPQSRAAPQTLSPGPESFPRGRGT